MGAHMRHIARRREPYRNPSRLPRSMTSSTFHWAALGSGGVMAASLLAFVTPALPVAVVALPLSLAGSLLCAYRADTLEAQENSAALDSLRPQL